MKRTRLSTLVAIAAVGCTGGEPPAAPNVPEVIGEVDLEIGLLEGPPVYTFGMISGLATGTEGQIFVSDSQEGVIRVFDRGGTFLHNIGREGEGPEEFRRPCCISVGPNGDLWVRDSGNRRYMDLGGSAGSEGSGTTIRMNHSDGALYAPITFRPDGSLIDVGHTTDAAGVLGLWRIALGRNGEVRDRELVEEPSPESLGTFVKDQAVTGGMARYYFPQPYGPTFLVAHGPRGVWATAVSSEYAVTLHTGADSVEIRTSTGEGPALSPGEREGATERLRAYLDSGTGKLSDYPEIPDRKPLLAGLYFDETGRLWVELSVEDGEDRHADLYDGGGELVGRRTWPSRVSLRFPAWLGEQDALGITTDSLGVQRVARVRF